MTITLSPDTAVKLIAFTTADRLDEAERVANAVAAQQAINDNPAIPAQHSSLVQINLQDAEHLVNALRTANLYAGLKLEWGARG
jgi:hypothetical protein